MYSIFILFVTEKHNFFIPLPYLSRPVPAPPTHIPACLLTSLAPHSGRGRSLHGDRISITDIKYTYHNSHLAFYNWSSIVHHLGPDVVQRPATHPGVAAGSTQFLNLTILALPIYFVCEINFCICEMSIYREKD